MSNEEAVDTYEFVPNHLRHHFKVQEQRQPEEDSADDSALVLAEKESVRHARQSRSANLVANLFAQPPPPGPTRFLYSHAIERSITARMTFARAVDGLEAYFTDVMAKVKQLKEQDSLSWWYGHRVKMPTLVQTQRQIVNVIQGCLSDCDVYLGMHEPLPSPPAASPTPVIRYVACSAKSSMLHQTLPCRLQPKAEQIGAQPQSGNQAEERFASITEEVLNQGHYVAIDNIAPLVAREQIHRFAPDETVTGPFACFPLLVTGSGSKSETIGVISVDTCRKAKHLLPQSMSVEALHAFLLRMQLKDAAIEFKKAKINGARFLALTELELRHKPNFQRLKVATRKKLLEIMRAFQRGSRMHLPESFNHEPQHFTQDNDALQFLENVSKASGKFLSSYRQFYWIQEIANITRQPTCTAYDIYEVLIRSITHSTESLERVTVWKITKSNKEAPTSKLPPHRSATPWEIDAIASTEVPGDRLLPFLDGEDVKIKRIAFYKERDVVIHSSDQLGIDKNGGHSLLIRGGVTNIVANPTSATTAQLLNPQPCENATYQISWANRSLQSATWNQLRQLLPIRNMNIKHFQLRHLCDRLEQEGIYERGRSKNEKVSAIRINSPNGLALIMRDNSRPAMVKYVFEVDFSAQFEPPLETIVLAERAVAVAEQALTCVRGREVRHVKRKLAVERNVQQFQSLGLNPSGDALRALQDIVAHVFDDIAANLPGVHIQIAELQVDGSHLKYTFTGNGSTILNCTLNRGQGVSFRCLDTKQPLVVGNNSDNRSRLHRLGALRSQSQAQDDAFPYIFVPLIHEDCVVGVLSVDSFQNVPKGRDDEAHPEAGVMDFLISLAKLLASTIYAKRRSYALHEIQLACLEPLRTPQQLLFSACRALKDVIVGGWKVRVVEVDGIRGKTTLVYEFSEYEREQERSWLINVVRPMAFRYKELCTDTIMNYLQMLHPDEKLPSDSVIKLLAAIREDEQERQNSGEPNEHVEAVGKALTNRERKSAADQVKFPERQIADKYFLLLDDTLHSASQAPKAPPGNEVDGASRLMNDRYIAHTMNLFLGGSSCLYSDILAMAQPTSRAFLTISVLPQFHAHCDHVYMQRVASITSKCMTALRNRVYRSRERIIALSTFRALCQKTLVEDLELATTATKYRGKRCQHRLTPAEEVEVECLLRLQHETIAMVERTLRSPHVYFGMWEPALRVIRYTSASKTSSMVGKKLKHGCGVSFLSLEKQVPVVISSRDATDSADPASLFKRLRFFTNTPLEDRRWPFIVVPVGTIGVLAIDNMTSYEQESGELQPELGVVDFLRKISKGLAETLSAIRERTCEQRQQLRSDALVRMMSACENFNPSTSLTGSTSHFLLHLAIQQIEAAFNGVDAYIGMVEPLCAHIRFVCTSTHSQMHGKIIDNVHSVSFSVFTKQRAIVIPDLTQYYKQQQLDHQHQGTEPKLKTFCSTNSPRGPFVCVPIPFVGVLSVDTFPGAAGGVFSPCFPEDGVVEFLERVANHIGNNIRTVAANDAKRLLPTLFHGNKTTFRVLFEAILGIISRNLLAVYDMKALQFARDNQTGSWHQKTILAAMKRSASFDNDSKLMQTHEDEEQLILRALEERFERQSQGKHQSEHEEDTTKRKTDLSAVHHLRCYPEIILIHCNPTRTVENDEAQLMATSIILRRAKGATWMYDEEFLCSILPHVNSLIELVNVRVEGIVARRVATQQVGDLCSSLESLPSGDAALQTMYTTVLPAALNCIAQAMSYGHCDTYLGERELSDWNKSSTSKLQLRFVAASKHSLMKDVTLSMEDDTNLSLAVVQCIQFQQPVVIPLSQGHSRVRSLTSKPAHRVFLAFPMGDNHVVCADSLDAEALVPGKPAVESDVLAFFKASASKLQAVILSVRHRLSFDQIKRLTKCSHADMKLFFSTVLDVLRRDLVRLHSQQILTLGEDFTSAYQLEAWEGARTRRPIATIKEHFCSFNGCERTAIAHEIHGEMQLYLPMSNLPRALDASRSRMQPVEAMEKRGDFTSACLATMLDSSVAFQGGDTKLALCVFSHDARTNENQGMSKLVGRTRMGREFIDKSAFFTNYQRQYFFAFAAVVADVFVHVFRACAFETFAAEQLMMLQEHLDAKDGMVVRLLKESVDQGVIGMPNIAKDTVTDDEGVRDDGTASVISGTSTTVNSSILPIVLFSQQPGKYPTGHVLRGKLERKVQKFYASNAAISIFMSKKAAPAPPAKDAARVAITVGNLKDGNPKPANRRGPMSLFRGRKLFRSRKNKRKDEEEERSKQQEQLSKAAPALKALSPSRSHQLQQTISFHVFVRAVEYQERCDVIMLTVENQSVTSAGDYERLIRLVKSRADALAAGFMEKKPKGDEEINGKRFCVGSAKPLMPNNRGGGGFLLLSFLKTTQEEFQQVENALGAAMRQFLQGGQVTARGDPHGVTPEDLRFLFGSSDDLSDTTPTTALLRVALVACGGKREFVVALNQSDLIKEFLRAQTGRKLVELDPTDRKQWGALARARILLRSFDDAIHGLGPRSADDSNSEGLLQKVNLALHVMLDLLLAQSAVVRYLKHLEAELAREQRQLRDEPAIMLQCFVRQKMAKVELTKRRREFNAALAIQCTFRQHLARRQHLFKRWNRAAVIVQRAYRRKRQRAKGSRPQRLTTELLAASQKYGALGRSPSVIEERSHEDGNGRVDMSAFRSFDEFLKSKIGREQIKRDEDLMWRHRKELEKERARLPRDEALREDVGDLFELLDDAGSGELSRERTTALITRLHVPLSEEEIADVVAMMDSDGSGSISMDEFMRWFSFEFPLLQKRAPRVCGVVTRRDWQWVIEQSARSASLKRWRAMRAGQVTSEAPRAHIVDDSAHLKDGTVWEEGGDDGKRVMHNERSKT